MLKLPDCTRRQPGVCARRNEGHLRPTPGLPNDPNNSGDILRCQKDRTVCEDSTPSKVINGITVNVSQVGGCWKSRSDYTCLTPQVQDTAAPSGKTLAAPFRRVGVSIRTACLVVLSGKLGTNV